MLIKQSLAEFCNELSSSSPAPGGGSVAALAGALGAALVAMVGNLTIGKKRYAVVESEMQSIIERGGELQNQLLRLVDADADAFNAVMTAMKLPKESDTEKSIRAQAIDDATKAASRTPLEVMRLVRQGLELADAVAMRGNQNSLSDAGVSALMLRTACEGAALNVRINLSGLHDEEFILRTREEINAISSQVSENTDRILAFVNAKI